jgi:hypothetical protein
MRLLLTLLLLAAAHAAARAQEVGRQTADAPARPAAADAAAAAVEVAPGLVVVKSAWSKERIGWERDPFAGPLENFDEMRARQREERRVEVARRAGSDIEADRAAREARADAANRAALRNQRPPRYVFMYRATVRNDGPKAIRKLDWDFVFTSRGTDEEAGRREFTSEEKIAPGKQKELIVRTRNPPARTVSVHELHDEAGKSLEGRVEIVRVEYADGTVWQRADGAAHR